MNPQTRRILTYLGLGGLGAAVLLIWKLRPNVEAARISAESDAETTILVSGTGFSSGIQVWADGRPCEPTSEFFDTNGLFCRLPGRLAFHPGIEVWARNPGSLPSERVTLAPSAYRPVAIQKAASKPTEGPGPASSASPGP